MLLWLSLTLSLDWPLYDVLRQVVRGISQNLPQVHKARIKFLNSACQLARELTSLEAQDHSLMQALFQSILKGKRLHLFEGFLAGIQCLTPTRNTCLEVLTRLTEKLSIARTLGTRNNTKMCAS